MVILGFLLVFILPFAVGIPVGYCTRKGSSSSSASGSGSAADDAVFASVSPSVSASASATASASDSAVSPSASAETAPAPASPPTSVWQPAVGATWQIVLSEQVPIVDGKPSPNVDIYDMDLFDVEASTISALHAAGKKVICYFSAGSYEDWRPDAKDWDHGDLGADLQGWAGEKWVKTGSEKVRSIMAARLKMAAEKGCDAVDPDNVDAYNNENGLGLQQADAEDYVKFLAQEAAKHNMGCGLKNAAAIVPAVSGDVQFSVVEQCAEYGECGSYQPMIQASKPVFSIEYPSQAGTEMPSDALAAQCNADGSGKFSMVMKKMALDQWVEPCEPTFDS